MPKVSREDVYVVIDGERDWQDAGKGNAQRHEDRPEDLSPGEILLCMQKCLNDAIDAWYKPDGGTTCLPKIRKIAALGVQAMENYGAPERKVPNE